MLAGVIGCGDNHTPPSSRIGVGIIGVGGFGSSDWILGNVLRNSQLDLIAIADVDASHRDPVLSLDSRIAGYADYRDLLARDDIDAVYVILPHHWHALAAIHAAQAGKHVWCEKPLSLTVVEGREMVTAARKANIAFQTGSQQRSMKEFLIACEVVRNGRIGELTSIDVAIMEGPFRATEPTQPIPEGFDWDFWLGPAPEEPYHQLRTHINFRYFRDTGGGMVTDLGAHMLDIAQWGLDRDLSGPVSVSGTGTYPPDNFFEEPTRVDVDFMYDNGVPVHLYTDALWGVTFRGTDGDVFVSRGQLAASRPEIIDWVAGTGDVVLEQSSDHHQNWIDAIRNGTRPICDVEIGHRSATACHLANIAITTGRTLTWDPNAEHFIGDAEANGMLSRPKRAPFAV